jgi:hypothetical protein
MNKAILLSSSLVSSMTYTNNSVGTPKSKAAALFINYFKDKFICKAKR